MVIRKGIVNQDAIPDPYDLNNYCNACEKSINKDTILQNI